MERVVNRSGNRRGTYTGKRCETYGRENSREYDRKHIREIGRGRSRDIAERRSPEWLGTRPANARTAAAQTGTTTTARTSTAPTSLGQKRRFFFYDTVMNATVSVDNFCDLRLAQSNKKNMAREARRVLGLYICITLHFARMESTGSNFLRHG